MMPEYRVRYEQIVTYEMTVTADNHEAAKIAVDRLLDEGGVCDREVDSLEPVITDVIDPDGVSHTAIAARPAWRGVL